MPIYGLSIAQITDHLTPKQYIAGGASAILVNGAGAAIGPLIISLMMKIIGIDSYFIMVSLVFGWLCLYGLYRTQKRDAIPLEDQGDYTAMPVRPTPMSMSITEEGHSILKEMEKK